MKKALLAAMAVLLVLGFAALKCEKDEIVSVTLSPTGDQEVAFGDSLEIKATTDPAEVDKVVFSGIDVEVTEGTEGVYSTSWKAEAVDTEGVYITAKAVLGENELESEDTLHIVVPDTLPEE
ncbi:hypothetical protein CEE36_09730 [candidate division TA06 bacterium B3_TA06]|uniref:BIG2 domain-containing protein n=1 Tax=candidate division TA06 bacterium B3_TA06 TaxID=2012487 RepID=A0A532UZ26_UNCT6|nr:MAG: hypothetical protein CEE36_09730 [candidate division TA06 bacterium B3_TA06]